MSHGVQWDGSGLTRVDGVVYRKESVSLLNDEERGK